ncbi:zinc finger protein 569 [Pangasianodon hypophthalmus]|uniref:zinc finger protein 569 n=1 Tax=Pangasianodon hypophthalmus TaxID=310915 RepID=UPI0023073FDF|nr:zinc finger protein 569 [Pangasianodon hypophthalmus]
MDTGLPSAPSLRRIKTEQNTQCVPLKNGCILSLQTVDLPSDLTCPVRVKQESDLPQSEYLPCPQFEELKDESTEMNEFIKEEQHDDSSLTLTSEASRQGDDNLPHGLIPPIEMEDDECDVECAENLNTCLNQFLNKKRNAAKIKLHASNTDKTCTRKQRKAPKHTKYHCVKGRDGRTLLKTRAHTDSEEAVWCETCGKEFKRFDLLSDHRRVHSRKRPYACDQCGMMFAKPAYLKIHLRRHAGERAFPCDQCDKRFFDKYDLGVHQRDHTGERPYVCRECGKSFKRIYILNKHKKTHSNEKPFECHVCGKAYKYGYSYRLHMKNHSA